MNLAQKQAIALAGRKLKGEQFKQAKGFILRRLAWREEALAEFVQRLESLPDIEVSPDARQPRKTLFERQVAEMRRRRAAGEKLADLAEAFEVSVPTASRYCSAKGSYADPIGKVNQ